MPLPEYDQRIKWCRAQPTHSYNTTRLSIEFQPCGFKTFNQMDINNRYCPACHQFIDDVIANEARDNETS